MNGVVIIDCAYCGELLYVHDTSGELRDAVLLRFIRLWRSLEPEKEYTVDSLARALKTHADVVLRYARRFCACSLDGKPIPREVFGIRAIRETGKYEYFSHNTAVKDADPEEGLPWPLEVRFLSMADVHASEFVVGQDVSLRVEVEYCFTVPARIWLGIPSSNGFWLSVATDVLVGSGSKTYALSLKAPPEPQDMSLKIQALHQHHEETWDLADEVLLDFSVKEPPASGAPAFLLAALLTAPIWLSLLVAGLAKLSKQE